MFLEHKTQDIAQFNKNTCATRAFVSANSPIVPPNSPGFWRAQEHLNSLSVAKLNRQYLRFARLAAKDVAAGRFEMPIRQYLLSSGGKR
jgi:hypothetical protein